MKSIFTFLSLFMSMFIVLQGQNSIPKVDNIQTELRTIDKKIIVRFDVQDVENDSIRVRLKASTDGEFYQIIDSGLSGDIGDNIGGGQKTITWAYPESTDLQNISLKLSIWDHVIPDVGFWVNQVSEDIIRQYMDTIEGRRHYSTSRNKLESVKNFIHTDFVDKGLSTYRQDFIHLSQNGQNIIGRKPGLINENRSWIIDAHFDSVSNSPGADDNASGVCGVLEMARVLEDYALADNVVFIGFDFEEAGLIGATRYVSSGIRTYEKIQGVYNMEMIGYYSDEPNSQTLPTGFNILFPEVSAAVANDQFRGNFLTNIGNTASASLIATIQSSAAQWVPELKVHPLAVLGNGSVAPDLRRSDHAPFWDAGIKALMLTDGSNFRNQNYHTPGDSSGTLDFTFMTRVVKTILGAVSTSAQPLNGKQYNLGGFTTKTHDHQHTRPLISLYPNPAQTTANVRILGMGDRLFRVRLMNTEGTILKTNHMYGMSEIQMPLDGLYAGLYLVVIDSGELTMTKELMIGGQ
ncbi:MAG: M28 family peptidase [Saprospiraceae bacterium]